MMKLNGFTSAGIFSGLEVLASLFTQAALMERICSFMDQILPSKGSLLLQNDSNLKKQSLPYKYNVAFLRRKMQTLLHIHSLQILQKRNPIQIDFLVWT